jgi:hypothetical protein
MLVGSMIRGGNSPARQFTAQTSTLKAFVALCRKRAKPAPLNGVPIERLMTSLSSSSNKYNGRNYVKDARRTG